MPADADRRRRHGHQVALAVGPDTTIDLAVTVGDATTFYKIVVTRGAAAADATLSDLSLGTSGVTLNPTFSRHTYSYSATVPNSVDMVTVTPTDNADAIATYRLQVRHGPLGRRGQPGSILGRRMP